MLRFLTVASILLVALLTRYATAQTATATTAPGQRQAVTLTITLADTDTPACRLMPGQETVAGFYQAARNHVLAEPLFSHSLDAPQKRFGQQPDEPTQAENLRSLALVYQEQGRNADAEALFRRAIAFEEKSAGSNHPDLALALSQLAGLYVRMDRPAAAAPLYQRALQITEAGLGRSHTRTAATLNNLGVVYALEQDLQTARPFLEQASAIFQQTLGGDHPDTVLSRCNLAQVETAQGNLAEAQALFAELAAVSPDLVSTPGSLPLADDLRRLGRLYAEQGMFSAAEPLFKRALIIQENALDSQQPALRDNLMQALQELAGLYERLRLWGLAEPLYLRALEISDPLYGSTSQQSRELREKLAEREPAGDHR